jgi:DNA-binding protein H-NS
MAMPACGCEFGRFERATLLECVSGQGSLSRRKSDPKKSKKAPTLNLAFGREPLRSANMEQFSDTLAGMTIDELWDVRAEVDAILKAKLTAEKSELERRLAKLRPAVETSARRPYPKVLPKYRNPSNRSETWAGRGKQPGWVRKLLRSGKRIDDFRIDGAAT